MVSLIFIIIIIIIIVVVVILYHSKKTSHSMICEIQFILESYLNELKKKIHDLLKVLNNQSLFNSICNKLKQ